MHHHIPQKSCYFVCSHKQHKSTSVVIPSIFGITTVPQSTHQPPKQIGFQPEQHKGIHCGYLMGRKGYGLYSFCELPSSCRGNVKVNIFQVKIPQNKIDIPFVSRTSLRFRSIIIKRNNLQLNCLSRGMPSTTVWHFQLAVRFHLAFCAGSTARFTWKF